MESIEAVAKSLTDSLASDKIVDADTLAETQNGISLLALKNDALLSYISNLLLLAGAQLEQNADVFSDARRRTIEQRVTLEKGVKGLEAKISYQIDKALRAYRQSQDEAEKAARAGSDDSDSDAEAISYRPNVASLKSAGRRDGAASDDDVGADDDKKRYVVPKISATLPSFDKARSAAPRRRDFALEEYLRESGEAPIAEPSIGSQIQDSGRGGERTERDRRKDREVQEYEESNFTRITNPSSKRARKAASQRQRDATTKNFFGEDWGILDGNDGRRNSTKKRKTRR